MPDTESTILEADDVKVTNLRVVIGAKTYALSNITSVELGRKEPSGCVPDFLILAGVGSVVIALTQLFGPASSSTPHPAFPTGWIIAAAFLLAGGILALRSGKPEYTVKVGSASGESNILASQDEPTIRKIVDAINTAIVQRG